MGLTTEEYKSVKAVFDKKGIPEYVWLPIMQSESGGNPKARANTSREDSRGLFQINVKAHPQWKDVNLYDPVENAKIAVDNFIAPAYGKAMMARSKGDKSLATEGDVTAYVWRYGIRPAWTSEKEKSIKQKVTDFLKGGGDGEKSVVDKVQDALPTPSNIQNYIDGLIQRFLGFAWILIPLLLGLIILIFTVKSMFLDTLASDVIGGVVGE